MAVPGDGRELHDIAVEANIDAWTIEDYESELQRRRSFVITARNSRIRGFLVARLVPGSVAANDVDLYNIAVRPEDRRSGLGSRLLAELLGHIRPHGVGNIWLEVRASNLAAIRFYESQGFFPELTRPNFYTAPVESAVIMRLRLEP